MAETSLSKDTMQSTPSIRSRARRAAEASAVSFWTLVRPRVKIKRFLRDLWHEIRKDEILNGAAIMAYFSMLAIFPAAILILTLLPYLGIPNLEQTIISALYRSLPDQAAELFTSTVTNVVSERRGGLLSFAILGTIWAASSGLQVVMEQIHATYDGQDKRPYWKRRGIAILLVFAVGLLVVGAFGLVLVGDLIHDRLTLVMGKEALFLWLFPALRWGTIWLLMLSALSLFYYYGPDIRQRYRLITPGAVLATFLFIAASLGFRTYVTHFGSYEATYGSLGAVIVLLIWLYVGGLVVLIGAEVNGLLEGYCYQQKLAKSVRSQTKS